MERPKKTSGREEERESFWVKRQRMRRRCSWLERWRKGWRRERSMQHRPRRVEAERGVPVSQR
jgi:hypothetical protein